MYALYFDVLEFRELKHLGNFGDVRIVLQHKMAYSVFGARATLVGDCGDVELIRSLDAILVSHPLLLTPAHLGRVLGTDHISFHESVINCKTGVWDQVHQPVHRLDATMVDADDRLQDEIKRRQTAHLSVRLRQKRFGVQLSASLKLAALKFD